LGAHADSTAGAREASGARIGIGASRAHVGRRVTGKPGGTRAVGALKGVKTESVGGG